MAELYENRDKYILCPCCKKYLTMADKRDGRIHKLACKHCRKWIWFKPSDDRYKKIKRLPERETSSGVRFY